MPDNIDEIRNQHEQRAREFVARWNINPEVRFVNENNEEVELEPQQLNPIIRRRRGVGQVLDTVGIELESLGLHKKAVANILNNLPQGLGGNFQVHRDGSSEIKAYFLPNNVIVNAHTPEAEDLFERKYVKETCGYELISSPMDIDTAELTLYALLPQLEANGDFLSERCATHIHVGGMKNLGFLKRELKLALWFDEVFYSLAHVDGNRFRGYSNNAIYARPLINGPYFAYNRGYYQTLNWKKALNASDLYEFYACYGVNVENELPKYHPGRYFSINLYSIPRIGTVEFRHFNQTFNPKIVSAITKLCQLFVEVGIKSKMSDLDKLDVGDVFTLHSTSHYINKLYKFLSLAGSLDAEYFPDDDDIRTLESIISTYQGIGIENKEILTHCRDFDIPRDIFELADFKKARNKPEPDGHTDIHNIRYSSILGE